MNKKTTILILASLVFLVWTSFVLYSAYRETSAQNNNTFPTISEDPVVEGPDYLIPTTPQRPGAPDDLEPNDPTEPADLYTCPESGYIDCMPTVGSPKNSQCSTDYIDWAQQNCPDFQGVAY